ncbi:BZ3500_MvSof-1268-A1-R1_Chr2-3g05362 [Microbotryum saponariae]|uniref:BZ3500_MvSof-1268-A1-R1_Chr2-3g05362 protein n=1 Tax=Microbotryum saponariae TaxID=289078 RepID=A0A2X0M888_9BASI|nr:BZ3500_MvSof-1268-A1-R1_Chr2-3g05362 [Microbotryum saponariae]SDA01280.1 BZ3501_MvSof-1269-A2-R1_Chr2-2g05035 [Microbotryum saponariae]
MSFTAVRVLTRAVPDATFAGSAAQDGYLSTEMIHQQIEVVNSIFAASELPMNINLAQITYTNNPTWFEYGGDFDSETEREVIKNLRVGGAADINVFTVRRPRDGQALIMGYGTMPQEVQDAPLLDAIFLACDTLPGFSSEGGEVLQGKALAHELGHHLLGLPHTFEGGCSLINDGIADTPPQGYQTQGCTYNAAAQCQAGVPYVARGDDPEAKLWFNLMDYSNESCRGGLTPGQVAAGLDNWHRYRAQNISMNISIKS